MNDTCFLINHARIKLGITQDFQCFDNPINEEQYNNQVRWIVGEDANGNALYGNTQLVTWQQVQQYVSEAEQNWKLRLVRQERDKRLVETDWWAVADRTMTQEQKDYRQSLRDITNNCNPLLDGNDQLILSSINWPTKPE
jgi:hypothetical protein